MFLLLMDLFQRLALVEMHMQRGGIAAAEALEKNALPAWLSILL